MQRKLLISRLFKARDRKYAFRSGTAEKEIIVVNMKKTDSLIKQFAGIFILFTILTLFVAGIATEVTQSNAYIKENEKNIRKTAAFLEDLIQREGEEFLWFQNYIIEHRDDILIEMEFDDYKPAKMEYEDLLHEKYPGKTLGVEITFDDLSDEVKEAFAVYKYKYWILTFLDACKDNDLAYCYAMVPIDDKHVYYLIDPMPQEKEVNGEKYRIIAEKVEEDRDLHATLWEAWDTGKDPKGYDTVRNGYGNNYSFNKPYYINGHKSGVIGVDCEIVAVNDGIVVNTAKEVFVIAVVLIVAMAILLNIIYRRYLKKLGILTEKIEEYTKNKDTSVVQEIEGLISGHDEISNLASQTSNMILDIQNYINEIQDTKFELNATKSQALQVGERANKDSLTGIRNRNAFEDESRKIEWNLSGYGGEDFGIAMIDLNFLKKINDTYGHEKGNVTIIRLCQIICKTYKHSPVFRIGGDEFVVILKGEDLKNRYHLRQLLYDRLRELKDDKTLEPWEQPSAALGMALYDPNVDRTVSNVLKRADEEMYKNKKDMKAIRN